MYALGNQTNRRNLTNETKNPTPIQLLQLNHVVQKHPCPASAGIAARRPHRYEVEDRCVHAERCFAKLESKEAGVARDPKVIPNIGKTRRQCPRWPGAWSGA